jgi:hypothetical protein
MAANDGISLHYFDASSGAAIVFIPVEDDGGGHFRTVPELSRELRGICLLTDVFVSFVRTLQAPNIATR